MSDIDWRRRGYLIISQDTLIKQAAEREGIDAATAQKIFQSAEDIILSCLTSAPPSESVTIKIFNGICLERKYIAAKNYSKGMFQNIECTEHINVKANASKYYVKKVNEKLFHR